MDGCVFQSTTWNATELARFANCLVETNNDMIWHGKKEGQGDCAFLAIGTRPWRTRQRTANVPLSSRKVGRGCVSSVSTLPGCMFVASNRFRLHGMAVHHAHLPPNRPSTPSLRLPFPVHVRVRVRPPPDASHPSGSRFPFRIPFFIGTSFPIRVSVRTGFEREPFPFPTRPLRFLPWAWAVVQTNVDQGASTWCDVTVFVLHFAMANEVERQEEGGETLAKHPLEHRYVERETKRDEAGRARARTWTVGASEQERKGSEEERTSRMLDAIERRRRCTEMRRDADPRGRSDAWE